MSSLQKIHFVVDDAAAIDAEHGVRISHPRIQPGATYDESEYQYPISLGDKETGIGLFGEFSRLSESVNRHVIKLEPAATIDRILDVQSQLGTQEDAIAFLQEFARGLLLVYSSGRGLYKTTHFLVVAKEADIEHRFGPRSQNLERFGDGYLVISKSVVMRDIEAE